MFSSELKKTSMADRSYFLTDLKKATHKYFSSFCKVKAFLGSHVLPIAANGVAYEVKEMCLEYFWNNFTKLEDS